MPRQIANPVDNSFINGLVTEANVLNFPEKACTDTDNCVFTLKGDVTRRYGIDFEPGYTTKTFSREGVVVKTFYWMNAAGQSDKNFLVLQVGGNLYFYAITDNQVVSKGSYPTPVDFSLFATGDPALCGTVECEFAYGKGYLFGVNPYSEPFYVSYNPSTDSFSGAVIEVRVRDTTGITDSSDEYDNRPTTLTDTHLYNLYNQGWHPTTSNGRGGTVKVDMINTYRGSGTNIMAGATGTVRTEYPSNADVWWLFKDSNENFNRDLADKNQRGNTPAPKGYYIYNAFNLDRTTLMGLTLPNKTSGTARPRAIAFYAGRVWYAGVDAQDYGTTIYFSQLVKDPTNFGRCYQLNDPTNEFLFDLLATDGGTVDVLDMGSVVKILPVQNSLMIFATNGVWSISGNQGVGFTASDYSIRKVSSIPSVSASSFVDVEGFPLWWNNDGIYTVSGANAVGSVQIDCLTEKTIKTYYNENIPIGSKAKARGAYNPLTRQVQWVYRSYGANSVTNEYEFDKVLTFNVLTKAFYPWSLPNHVVKVIGVGSFKTLSVAKANVPTLDAEGNLTYDEHLEPVVTRENVSTATASVFKYLVSYPDGVDFKFTFAECYDDTYTDFKTYDGTGYDFESYLTTGYRLDGQGSKKVQSNYVLVHFRNRDEAAVDVQGVWNTATSVTSGYYGQKQRVTSVPTYKRDFDVRKLKARGNGRVLQLKFSSVTNKPFELAGWSILETINTSV